MGCVQSTSASASGKRKVNNKNGSEKKTAAAKPKKKSGVPKPSPAQKKAALKPSGGTPVTAAVGAGKKSSVPNPLKFTDDDPPQRDRLSSITSSSTSMREQLLAAQAAIESKSTAQDHVPLPEGKLQNLRVWIDSTEKKSLLDPQDTAGQQRREREQAGKSQATPTSATPQSHMHTAKKRMSILLSFTEVAALKNSDDNQPNPSTAVAQDSRSLSSEI